MSETIRLGVLGVGGGRGLVGSSRGAYLGRLAEQTGLIDTVAICDVHADRAEWAAGEMRAARAFTDIEAFLAAGIDAVLIATPVPLHAAQAVAALELGLAVLSEVTPVNSLVEAAELAAAVERTGGFYMLAENYCFIDDVVLVRRMAEDGRFGQITFAEGEYVHDTRDLAREADGTLTWRGQGRRGGLYCTHSLGPILTITGDRVATVSCFSPDDQPGNNLMLMRSVAGRIFKVRLDVRSPRPHNMAYYSVQGERGAYESWRGLGDVPKVWLDDTHEPSKARRAGPDDPIAEWHPLRDFAVHYIPERLGAPEAAKRSGHFGADYWMLHAFARALLDGAPSPIDAHRALDFGVPGILALASRAAGGAPVPVPDFRPAAAAVAEGLTPAAVAAVSRP